MHRLTLISIGKHGTPVGVYLSSFEVDEMLERLEADNLEDSADKTPHIDYILFENISLSIRRILGKSAYQSMVEGISKAMDLSKLLMSDPPKVDDFSDEVDKAVRDCIFLFLAAYPYDDVFSKYEQFLIERNK